MLMTLRKTMEELQEVETDDCRLHNPVVFLRFSIENYADNEIYDIFSYLVRCLALSNTSFL